MHWGKGKNTPIRDILEIWLTGILKPKSKLIHLSHILTDMDSMPRISPRKTSGHVRSLRKQIYESKGEEATSESHGRTAGRAATGESRRHQVQARER